MLIHRSPARNRRKALDSRALQMGLHLQIFARPNIAPERALRQFVHTFGVTLYTTQPQLFRQKMPGPARNLCG